MKTLYLILGFLIIGFKSFSQEKKELVKNYLLNADTLILDKSKAQINNALLDSILEYSWDSDMNNWMYRTKKTHKYDKNLNLLEETRYSWNNIENKWIYSSKYKYQYNEFNKDTLIELLEWDNENTTWVLSLKNSKKYDIKGNCISDQTFHWNNNLTFNRYGSNYVTYKYDNNNKLVEFVTYSWDYDNNNWRLTSKRTNEYDNCGNKIIEVDYRRNLIENNWNEDQKRIFTYDSLNNLIDYLELGKDKSSWKNEQRKVYTYDINNRKYKEIKYTGCIPYDIYLQTRDTTQKDTISITIECSFDNVCEYCPGSIWYLNEKESISFDTNDNIIEQYKFKYNAIEKLWEYKYKNVSVFDSEGNKIDLTSYTWDTLTTKWIFSNRFTYKFDKYGNEIESKSFWWDKENNEWVDDIINIHIYNTNNQWTEFETYWYSILFNDYYNIKRIEQSYSVNGNLIERIEYKKVTIDDNNWQENKRIVYYWNERINTIIPIKKSNEPQVVIYPNPCEDLVMIYSKNDEIIKTINIFISTGQLVYTKEIEAEEGSIYLESLIPGIYLTQIITDKNKIYLIKLLVK